MEKDPGLVEEKVRSERVYDGVLIKVRRDSVRLPDGNLRDREVVEHPGAVAVVPFLGDGRVVMVRQYRHAAWEVLLEIPAGTLTRGERPEDCARRETEEETGYRPGRLEKVASFYVAPGYSNEVIHLYAARDLTPSKPNPEEDEFLRVEIHGLGALKEMVRAGKIRDAKTLIGLLMVMGGL